MPSDLRLDNILRALLKPWRPDTTAADNSRIYASAAAVLTTLTNPLNVTLLTTQVLTAPAVWSSPDGLRAALRVFGTFQSATLGKMELEVQGKSGVIGLQEWIGNVVRGANHNVPRWKHILLLGGILSAIKDGGGSSGGNAYLIPGVTRRSLEDAFCRAVNLSLESNRNKELESDVVSLILSHSIQGLSHRAKKLIDYDALLPVVSRSIYYSSEGFQSGYFLSKIDNDVVGKDGKLFWPSKSNSLLELQQRLARPLFTSMSGVARLAGIAVREARNPRAIHTFLDRITEFSHTLTSQWQMNRLSQISQIDEPKYIDATSRKQTIPVVWQILKMVLFTTTLILQELATRLIQSEELADVTNGPVITSKILHILRGFYFITSRLGPNAFTSYNFVYMTSIDILSMHPKEAEMFVFSIAPTSVGTIPDVYMTRHLDLYFLNTTEHLVPVLSTSLIEELLIPACTPYLTATCDPNLHPSFEAAHSVMLAIIASPATAGDLAKRVLPFYIDVIFKGFPQGLSKRQFRLALSTLAKVCEVPGRQAELGGGDKVMEMGYERAIKSQEIPIPDDAGLVAAANAATATAAANAAANAPVLGSSSANATGNNKSARSTPALPQTPPPLQLQQPGVTPQPTVSLPPGPPTPIPSSSRPGTSTSTLSSTLAKQTTSQLPPTPPPPTFSEKEIHVLALIDCLPHLTPRNLSKWLPLVAALVAREIKDPQSRRRLRDRFWEALSGELDVERAEVAVRWWSEGGREALFEEPKTKPQQELEQKVAATKEPVGGAVMAGALPVKGGGSSSSRSSSKDGRKAEKKDRDREKDKERGRKGKDGKKKSKRSASVKSSEGRAGRPGVNGSTMLAKL